MSPDQNERDPIEPESDKPELSLIGKIMLFVVLFLYAFILYYFNVGE